MTALIALVEALLVATAALYVWALAAFLDTPVIRPVQRWLRRGWRWSLVSCPWCFGFWVSVALVALVRWGAWHVLYTPLTALAAAALVGIIGSNWTPGAVEPDDD